LILWLNILSEELRNILKVLNLMYVIEGVCCNSKQYIRKKRRDELNDTIIEPFLNFEK